MSAAERLMGLTLEGGWKVTQLLKRDANATGGTFSHQYLAERDGQVAFVKAFDFSEAFRAGVDTLAEMARLIASYEHERDVLTHCRSRKLSGVAISIGDGFVAVPNLGDFEGRVYYLIFEKADGDIRCQMDTTTASDTLWIMRAIRQICLGLNQIHREIIAHQDAKPSNVLCYPNGDFKITDFGRSSRRGREIFHDRFDVAGDQTYSPPELLYKSLHPEFVNRRIGTDLYMFGNLSAFLFTGTNITESICARLAPQHHWVNWRGDYPTVLPYIQEAYARVLEEVETKLPEEVRPYIPSLIRELCNPDLARRGHPRSVGKMNQYSLERYVSQLTHFLKMMEVRRLTSRRSA